jgi:hypothetical protein
MGGDRKKTAFHGWELTPLTIAAIYAFLGSLWVLFSDRVFLSAGDRSEFLVFLHGFLMLAFVVISAFILFVLINRFSKGIRRSEQQYRRTIDTLRDGILVLDRDLRCLLWNDTLSGWCAGGEQTPPVKGMELSAVFAQLPDSTADDYRRVMDTGTMAFAGPATAIGSLSFPSETRIIPIVGEDGTLGTVTVIRDITEEQQLDEIKKEMFRSLEKSALDFAILSDQIRNPLQIIVAITSLEENSSHETILNQARQIDRIVDRLDREWVEAERIKAFLKEHYGEENGSGRPPAAP